MERDRITEWVQDKIEAEPENAHVYRRIERDLRELDPYHRTVCSMCFKPAKENGWSEFDGAGRCHECAP